MLGYAQLLNVRWPIFVTNLSFVVPLIFITCKKRLSFCRKNKSKSTQEKQMRRMLKTKERNLHKKKNAKQKRTIQEDQERKEKKVKSRGKNFLAIFSSSFSSQKKK